MADKKVTGLIKLQIGAGKANPSPPVGPALGQHGVNIAEFCKAFNDHTKSMEPGLVVPVVISVYKDRSYTFVVKSPPAAVLVLKALGLDKGSGTPHSTKVGTINQAQLVDIAKMKMADLNATTLYAAVKSIAGTARSMGVNVAEDYLEGLENVE